MAPMMTATVRVVAFLMFAVGRGALALEPVAVAATQHVWQAGEPATINVDYDGTVSA